MTRRLIAVLLLVCVLAVNVHAQHLSAGISRDTIEINSNFTGADVVVFGAIESAESGAALSEPGPVDIAIVIRSDVASTATVRKKEPLGPIWVNRSSQQFVSVPEYYFVASSRPLKSIASESVLQQFEIGVENIRLGPAPGAIGGPSAFRKAFLQARQQTELYGQHDGGVTFMSSSLFRTTARLPPHVPAGNLRVTVYAFRGGQVTSTSSMTLFVDKTGIERSLTQLSQRWPLFYGMAAVVLAVAAGFLAAVAFRERQ